MSIESLKRTPLNNGINRNTPRKVNIDVLKKKIYEQEKKEKLHGKIVLLILGSFFCVLGFIISA